MKFSYSKLSAYKFCPMIYKFRYIDKKKEEESTELKIGNAIHKIISFFYRDEIPPSKEDFLNFVLKLNRDMLEDIRRMSELFYDRNVKNYRKPLFIEKKVEFEIEGIEIVGYIDKVDSLKNGIKIVDYKTGKVKPEMVERSEQLTIYQLGMEKEGYDIESLAIYDLRNCHEYISEPRRNAEKRRVINEILSIAEKIENGIFEPRITEWCQRCSFRNICPAFKDEQKQNMQDIVEKYAMLKMESERIKQEINELRRKFIEMVEKENISNFYSNRYVISVKRFNETKLDEEKIKNVLEPLGYWERVLKVDISKLGEVMRLLDQESFLRIKKAIKNEFKGYRFMVKERKEDV